MSKRVIISLAISVFACAALAQVTVTGTLIDVPLVYPQDAFDLNNMATYSPSAVYKDDIYALYYHGGGPHYGGDIIQPAGSPIDPSTWATTWYWSKQPCLNTNGTPTAPHYNCNDRVMMAWKHLAGASDNSWNIYGGRGNYPGMSAPYPWYASYDPWATVSGATPMAHWGSANSFPNPDFWRLPARQTFGGSQPNSYTSAGTPAVVYVNGMYFMTWDAGIAGNGAGGDTHRIAWSYSADGVNWTHTGLVLREKSEESDINAGALGDQLYYENGYFYMVVVSLSLSNMKPYLLRAAYTLAPPYHAEWRIPNGVDANGRYVWGAVVPDYNQTNQSAVDFNDASYVSMVGRDNSSGTCAAYAPHMSFAKVYASNTSTDFKYAFLLDVSGTSNCSTDPGHEYPIRLYTQSELERPLTSLPFDITAASNGSHASHPADYGWQPQVVWLVPNATYTRVYNPLTIFVENAPTARGTNHNVARIQLRLSGDIY